MPGFELFGQEERKEVEDVLATGVLFRYGFDQARRGHWKARTFETELSGRIGVQYSHLCSSGTAALTIALAACGVGTGDEIIVPPFTFIATIEAILLAGAIPVFGEIDETLCLDPDLLEAALTPRTKAVLPVHMCGAMARIDAIKAFCDRKGLMMIEDACQAFGGSFHGKALGTFGQAGCFSFDAVKTITCGEGGAVVTDDRETYMRMAGYGDHGHDHIGDDRGLEKHPILGLNFRISELNAAVGLAQLRKLGTILETQRAHKRNLKEALSGLPGIRFRTLPDPAGDSATFLSFFLPDENQARSLCTALGGAGVDGCFYWYDNNWHYLRRWDHLKKLQSAARIPIQDMPHRPDYEAVRLPQSDRVIGRNISMAIKLSWQETDLSRRADQMRRIIKELA